MSHEVGYCSNESEAKIVDRCNRAPPLIRRFIAFAFALGIGIQIDSLRTPERSVALCGLCGLSRQYVDSFSPSSPNRIFVGPRLREVQHEAMWQVGNVISGASAV